MKRLFFTLLVTVLFAGFFNTSLAYANGGYYIVQPGDTLYSVATAYGVSVGELAAANGLGQATWVYEGQQLVIPAQQAMPAQQFSDPWGQPQPNFNHSAPAYNQFAAPQPNAFNQYPAVNEWVEVDYFQQSPPTYQWSNANLYNPPPPVKWSAPPAQQGMFQPQAAPYAEKWIDVNLTNQSITAFEGQIPVFSAVVSTGTWQTPTVVGTFQIYVKYEKARMRGGSGADYYDLPNVPYVMYFHKGYGLHGTYWHNNFGTPMSHGCVNLSISDAQWLYNWAQVGTKVVTHY